MATLPEITNLFHSLPGKREVFASVLKTPTALLEHIVSNGETSEEGFWYDQERPEWVMLAKGSATLEFESGNDLNLVEGDSLVIPARTKHRVSKVSQDAVWIALHYQE